MVGPHELADIGLKCSSPLPAQASKRSRLDSSAFEGIVVRTVAEQLTFHFRTPVDDVAVKNLCDTVLGPGWSVHSAKKVHCEDLSAEVFGFAAACGLRLQEFSFDEQRHELWPLYLTMGPVRTYSFLQALSISEVRLYLMPLRKLLSASDFGELSVEVVREEIADLQGVVRSLEEPACGSNSLMLESNEERANMCLLYVKLRHSEDVRRHFRVPAVDAELARCILTALAERDVRALVNGKAPVRAVLARYEARRQLQEYRNQNSAAGRGPGLRCCQGCRV
eukprot:TRINITY_DN47370_c0_g1_i1.p1 TRINITY_DN47370_c0_g1~~TRINITY_DN47370_c0_g1_i1.p1  ORF type:complete len:280 (+),score=36.54 TRINITY_DN47370_c0_g1_i1:59-898(+)